MNGHWIATAVAAAALMLSECGCSQKDTDEAKRKLHETGQELKHDARKAEHEIEKSGHQAAQEIRRDAHGASAEIKKQSKKLKHETR